MSSKCASMQIAQNLTYKARLLGDDRTKIILIEDTKHTIAKLNFSISFRLALKLYKPSFIARLLCTLDSIEQRRFVKYADEATKRCSLRGINTA